MVLAAWVNSGPEGGLDQRPGVIEGQVQADLAGLVAQRLELPEAVQLAKRPLLDQAHARWTHPASAHCAW